MVQFNGKIGGDVGGGGMPKFGQGKCLLCPKKVDPKPIWLSHLLSFACLFHIHIIVFSPPGSRTQLGKNDASSY